MAHRGLAGPGGVALRADRAGHQSVALSPAAEHWLAGADPGQAGAFSAAGVVVQFLATWARSSGAQRTGSAGGLSDGRERTGFREAARGHPGGELDGFPVHRPGRDQFAAVDAADGRVSDAAIIAAAVRSGSRWRRYPPGA